MKQLLDTARTLPVEVEGVTPKKLEKMAQRIESEDQVNDADFETLQQFAKGAEQERVRLRKDLASKHFQDARLSERLVPFQVFDTQMDRLKEAHRLASAKAAVTAVAGASFGAAGLVSAYHAYANLPKAGLKGLVQALQEEPGKRDFAGNQVEQVHQERLWKGMTNLLDDGLASAKAGKRVEVNAQYYELTSQSMLHQLAENAAAGNKVRVNVDPGALVPFKGETLDADDLPDKFRGMLQLMDAPGDIGVSLYPRSKLLGSAGDLMHRKGLRVGDRFLLSGMNANNASGENVDAGYVIEGPAARQLGVNFKRDVEQSAGASLTDLYGEGTAQKLLQRPVKMGRRGLMSMIDALDGPTPPGTNMMRPKNFADLESFARQRGFELRKFLDLPEKEQGARLDEAIAENRPLPLSDYGKERLLDLVKLVQREANSPKNLKRLQDITPPSDSPKGSTVVSLADTPTQREALLLRSIHEADKFIYVPAFVITRPVAAALVAKAEEMKNQGKSVDIRVLADPGIYPDGGTPNEWGVKFLEDHNIPVRWALLPRTGYHDRKVHAKELLTDKTDFVGSTNFSNKGLRENHEHSGAIHFRPEDPLSQRQHQQARSSFEELWDHYSLEANSKERAQLWKKDYQGADHEFQVEQARSGAIRKTLRGIAAYESASADWVNQQVQSQGLEGKIHQLLAQGYDDGSAKLKALRDHLGSEAFLQGLQSLPAYQSLRDH